MASSPRPVPRLTRLWPELAAMTPYLVALVYMAALFLELMDVPVLMDFRSIQPSGPNQCRW